MTRGTTRIAIAGDQAMSTLREVVCEQPEFTYMPPDGESCQYVHDGAPSCLVGHVLHRLGVPLAKLSGREGDSAADVADVLTTLPEPARRALNVAQCEQDNGKPWSAALRSAEYEYDASTV